MAVFIISLTIGHKYFSNFSSSSGVNYVLLLRINPIFSKSIDKTGYLYFSNSFWANKVLPVWDAPEIKIIILPKRKIVGQYL